MSQIGLLNNCFGEPFHEFASGPCLWGWISIPVHIWHYSKTKVKE